MTGEIEMNGDVTAIGGLESKLFVAKKAGVELVFVPKENEKDYEKIIKKNKIGIKSSTIKKEEEDTNNLKELYKN